MTAAEAVARFPGAVFLVGLFDPVAAVHARVVERTARPGCPLVILLADPPAPLLPSRSRAELVAALARVDAVVLPGPDGAPAGLDLAPEGALVREEMADLDRRRALMLHVHRRHSG